MVKVKVVGEAEPSAGLLEVNVIVTSAVGLVLRRTVNVAVPPASVVCRPKVGVIVKPATSSSILVTETSSGFKPL